MKVCYNRQMFVQWFVDITRHRVCLLIYCSLISASLYAQPKKGEIIPDLSLPDTTGMARSLSSFRGKIVLVDFWASWCIPCRQSNPALVELYKKYSAAGFEIYGISIDKSADTWKKAIIADSITWVQVNDSNGWEAPVTIAWKVDYIPASFLVSKEGKVVAINPDHRKLRSYLKKNLR